MTMGAGSRWPFSTASISSTVLYFGFPGATKVCSKEYSHVPKALSSTATCRSSSILLAVKNNFSLSLYAVKDSVVDYSSYYVVDYSSY